MRKKVDDLYLQWFKNKQCISSTESHQGEGADPHRTVN